MFNLIAATSNPIICHITNICASFSISVSSLHPEQSWRWCLSLSSSSTSSLLQRTCLRSPRWKHVRCWRETASLLFSLGFRCAHNQYSPLSSWRSSSFYFGKGSFNYFVLYKLDRTVPNIQKKLAHKRRTFPKGVEQIVKCFHNDK